MQPHEQRVVEEQNDLIEKIERLDAFMRGAVFRALPAQDQVLLTQQHGIMGQYANVLGKRIIRFTQSEAPTCPGK